MFTSLHRAPFSTTYFEKLAMLKIPLPGVNVGDRGLPNIASRGMGGGGGAAKNNSTAQRHGILSIIIVSQVFHWGH